MASGASKSRTVGVVYLLYFLTAMSTVAVSGRAHLVLALSLISVGLYATLAALFYELFKTVSRSLSLVAALISLAGCVVQALGLIGFTHINSLMFFGPYCLLIGYLVLRCDFLPGFLGVLLVLAGLGWVLILLPHVPKRVLTPAQGLGILAEGLLMLWLLVAGVNVRRGEAA